MLLVIWEEARRFSYSHSLSSHFRLPLWQVNSCARVRKKHEKQVWPGSIFSVGETHAGSLSLSFLRRPRTFLVRFFSPGADGRKGEASRSALLSFKLAVSL